MAGKVRAMGRSKTRNKDLPKYVELYHGTFYYRGPVSDWKRKPLGRTFAEAMQAFGEMFRESPLRTWGDVCDRYEQIVTPTKSKRTQLDERAFMVDVRKALGRMTDIRPVDCYAFRDAIARRSGPVQANLRLALLKHMFVKAIEWGAYKTHPARDVKKLPVPPRTRLPEPWEFELVYGLAPPVLQCAMDLAVLTSMDRGDILALERKHCQDEGIRFRRSKVAGRGGREIIIEWSDELRAVIDRAKKLKPQFRQRIIATRSGKPFTASGFSTLWQRVMVAAEKQGLEERFHFHDLRALSISEDTDLMVASERAGHSSPEITKRVYRRKPARVRPLR